MKDKLNQAINISITPGTIVKIIFILLITYLLYLIKDLLLVILTSVVIASAVEPAARWFGKRKIPRVLSVLFVYVGVILVLGGFFAVFLPPLVEDVQNLVRSLPEYLETLPTEQFDIVPGLNSLISSFANSSFTGEFISQFSSGFSGAALRFLTTASAVFGGLLSFVLIIIISFYLAVQENGVENFIRIITPIEHEKYVLDLWKRSQRKIGLWAQGQLLLGVIIAILTYLGLSVFGVSNPMFLALLAGLFELIPIFGPILAAIPAVAFAFIDGGVSLALIVAGLYLIIQQFESQLIHPLVVKKMVGIPALIAIISLIIGAQIAGFLGILISVPVAATIMEYLGDLEKRKRAEINRLESK